MQTVPVERRYYLIDGLNSVVATIDTAGDVRRYLCEPYGKQIRSWIDTTPTSNNTGTKTDGTAAEPPDGSEGTPTANDGSEEHNPWRFASGYLDPETGWLKFGTRGVSDERCFWH